MKVLKDHTIRINDIQGAMFKGQDGTVLKSLVCVSGSGAG